MTTRGRCRDCQRILVYQTPARARAALEEGLAAYDRLLAEAEAIGRKERAEDARLRIDLARFTLEIRVRRVSAQLGGRCGDAAECAEAQKRRASHVAR